MRIRNAKEAAGYGVPEEIVFSAPDVEDVVVGMDDVEI